MTRSIAHRNHVTSVSDLGIALARRSAVATAKDTAKITQDKLPVRGYQELVAHLATLTRNTVSFAGKCFEKLSAPTPEQRRVFDLLGKPIPLRLDAP